MKTLYDNDGRCSLQHLNMESSRMILDDVHGCVDDECRFNVTKFREAISDPARGSTPDVAIIVTGTTGIQSHCHALGFMLGIQHMLSLIHFFHHSQRLALAAGMTRLKVRSISSALSRGR